MEAKASARSLPIALVNQKMNGWWSCDALSVPGGRVEFVRQNPSGPTAYAARWRFENARRPPGARQPGWQPGLPCHTRARKWNRTD